MCCAETRWPTSVVVGDAFADFHAMGAAEQQAADLRVGRPGTLSRASLNAGVMIMVPVANAIAEAIASAGTWARAEDKALNAIASFAQSSSLSAMIALPAIKGDLAGQLMVHGNEAHTVQLADSRAATFLETPWEEAIAEFRAREIMNDREFERLLETYRERGANAREMMLRELQTNVSDMIETAMLKGQTFRQFRKAANDNLAALGITDADPAYLETVFRTNIQTAYGAGRWRAMTSPEVAKARPLWQYRAVGDGRTRASHAALDGLVFEVGNASTDRLAPPGGFNCRCAAVSLASAPSGVVVMRSVPPGGEPDAGFAKPPTSDLALAAE